MQIEVDIEPEMPVVNKVFFLIPLRLGLITWGYVQLVINIIYGIYVIVDLAERSRYFSLDFLSIAQLTFFFILTMAWIFVDALFCWFMIMGAQKKNGNFLEVSYDYLKVKLPFYASYALFLMIVHAAFYSYNWFDRNFDEVVRYLIFEERSLVILMWLGQLYLMVLVNSMIISLGHSTDYKTLYARIRKHICRMLSSHDDDDVNIVNEPEIITKEFENITTMPRNEEKKMIYDVC